MMSDLMYFLELIRLRTYWCPHHYEFRNQRGVVWCCFFCHWYLDSLSIFHYTISAYNTEYWQGMMSVLIYLLVLIRLRIYWCPLHYGFGNHRGVALWYNRLQLVSGEVEYITLHYKCFHHLVLAGNDVSFDIFPSFDPSKNILVAAPL